MRKSGRKSAAEKAAAATLAEVKTLAERPPAPDGLSDAESSRWDTILATYDASHWRVTDLSLIETMVRTETYVIDCEDLIRTDGQLTAGYMGAMRENPAIAVRDRHLKTIISIQRALRLCPSTRTRADKAGHQSDGKESKAAPWEK